MWDHETTFFVCLILLWQIPPKLSLHDPVLEGTGEQVFKEAFRNIPAFGSCVWESRPALLLLLFSSGFCCQRPPDYAMLDRLLDYTGLMHRVTQQPSTSLPVCTTTLPKRTWSVLGGSACSFSATFGTCQLLTEGENISNRYFCRRFL